MSVPVSDSLSVCLTTCLSPCGLQVDALRARLEEKEQVLSKKSKQLQDLSDEKSTMAGEIRDMKDMLEVKERKVAVLQKKVRRGSVQNRDGLEPSWIILTGVP